MADKSGLLHQVVDLSLQQRARLELLLAAKRRGGLREREIVRRSDPASHPLSFAQQRLWFLEQLLPGTPLYTTAAAIGLSGPLDVEALLRALNRIVARHESLRAVFFTAGGKPVQAVAPALTLSLPVVDLGALPAPGRERWALGLAAELVERPFDLARGPLLRTTLMRLGGERHVLSVVAHHIVCDGWSVAVFLRELSLLYGTFSGGRLDALPELPIQYADFAAWQTQWLRGEVLEAQVSYWRQRLDGSRPSLDLPLDRPRPGETDFRGSALAWTLPQLLVDGARILGERHGATLFMTLLAVFAVLLSRYSSRADLAVGSPVANRNRRDIEDLIGFFVNTLVLRLDLSGDPSFSDLLDRVRETALGAYAHQDLPFERLVEELQPERDLSHSPLFQVMLVLQNALPPRQAGAVALTPLEIGSSAAQFELSLEFTETPDGMRGRFRYRTALFLPATLARMAQHFRRLLEAAVAEPDRPIGGLPLLSSHEVHQLAGEWSDTAEDVDGIRPVHELVSARAARAPEALAVEMNGACLTYGELDRQSNRLARYLRRLGAGPEVPVGCCLERSLDLVVGLLAVLKSGGACVPMDPTYPAARLGFLLEDSKVPLLLTRQGLPSGLPEPAEVRILRLDDERGEIDRESGADLEWRSGLKDPAYWIYTSGTTGFPKAVVVQHASLANVLFANRKAFGWDAGDRMAVIAPASFDIFLFELLNPLLAGGSAVLFGLEPTLDLAGVVAALGDLTALHAVPAVLRQVVVRTIGPRGGERPLAAPKKVFVGGDAVPADLLAELRRSFPHTRGYVLYGPTEGTIICSSYALPMGEVEDRPFLGRPLANARLVLLDADGRLVPVGVPGELCIGGVGVARCYRGQAGLTAERFVPDPVGREPGGRLYRSGDLARWRGDGTLEFVGRTDEQVKIRGFRVEPGEIEAVLAGHRAVQEAVVVAREDGPGDRRLVAYVVGRPGGEPEVSELRRYLRERLPEFMVPSALVVLESLPLTPNGKVDRRALPAPSGPRPEGPAPGTPVEEMVAAVWGELLGLERVGSEEDFFALGGHSLLATQMVSRLNGVFGIELPLRRVFESPTVAALAPEVERLRRAGRQRELPPLERLPRGGPLPLSFAQQRLWFIDQLAPDSWAYNICSAVRLRGRLKAASLEGALAEIVRRHEVLRTRFTVVGGEPVQVVETAGRLALPWVDLGGLAAELREPELVRLASAEVRRPFALERGPLVRATLVHLGEREQAVLLSLHHIVADGWSMGVLLRELGVLYPAFCRGEGSPLPPLAIQYADFAGWQRRWLQGEALAGALAYWRGHLAGVSPLELPSDRPRPAVQSFAGAVRPLVLAPELVARLDAMCRRLSLTRFMVLLAAFAALLCRYTRQEDVAVGSPIAHRTRAETEGLIGFFVNMLVMRTDLSGEPTVEDLLRRVREVTLEAYEHQELPFERLVEELQPERTLSQQPLFQVALALQNMPLPPLELPELSLSPVWVESRAAQFDLVLELGGQGAGLEGWLRYRTDRFDGGTMVRLGEHYRAVLEGLAAASAGERVWSLPLLGQGERHQLLREWNDTASAYGLQRCIHELFAEQAERRPGAVAVELGSEALSYGEVEERSNRLAHHLRSLGVGREEVVGLCVERCPALVVGMLGILKAGGAYLPLDAGYPWERLAFMLSDASVRVLVTEERHAGAFAGLVERLVRVDGEREAIGRCSAARPASGTTADSLAYVMYTSGSTGEPKGVAVCHRGIHRLVSQTDYVTLGPGDRIAQASNTSFDATTFEIWGALTNGGRVVGISRDLALSPATLAAQVRDFGMSAIFLTTALFNQVVAEEPAAFRGVRDLLFGGQAADPSAVGRLLAAAPPQRLLNVYGPTENTTFSTWYRVESVPPSATTVPIGRSITNSCVYLLDSDLQPVPVGVTGELFLVGDGLARAYLRRPGLTAERFLPDPYGEVGTRMYRTGDLVRWSGEGALEFLGRVDHQVKIRGFRVEPGEVEAVLAEYPAVREVAVVAREDQRGDSRLVAYVVSSPDWVPTAAELRSFLKTKLPEYMVPAAFVALETLPLTPNGKVDRRALPQPEAVQSAAVAYAAPRTPVEEIVAAIWSAVLSREQVGIEDDFFELGGHSLLATQVISRINGVFQIELPLRNLFEGPTVAALAREVEALRRAAWGTDEPPIEPIPRDGPLPLSFAQQRLWFLDRLQPGSPYYNVPVAVRFCGRLDARVLERSLAEVVARHEALRTTFTVVDGQPVQVIAPAAALQLPEVVQQGLPAAAREAEVVRVGTEEARRPFDLEKGPLVRVTLLRLGLEESMLLLSQHHIVSDGWSMGVLVRELAALYAAFLRQTPSPLPPLPVQYADFAQWQRRWLQGRILEAHLAYWRGQLGGNLPELRLPADRRRPSNPTLRSARAPLAVSAQLLAELKSLARKESATLFMVLLAAFKALLFRYSGQHDIVVGTPIANRTRSVVEGMVGFFANALALRTDLSGNPTFREVVARVRKVTLDAYAHQDVPFEKLVEVLRPDRSLNRNPLFQVVFVLQNAPMPDLELPGLSVGYREFEAGVAKFDLVLSLVEEPEGLRGGAEYATDLFEATTVEGLMRQFQTLLRAVVQSPETRVSQLPLVSAGERERALASAVPRRRRQS